MNKIDFFTITALTVKGFKCFAEKQSFVFGGLNLIIGHNGQGKSSIADAISYAIIGVPFFGGENSLDRLYTLESKDISVELSIQTDDGITHKLTRSRVNDTTSITYDGITIRQSDICDMFGERDIFLSIFNPLYFIEVLGDKGRNLLERHLPTIPHETVLDRLSESTRVLLENVSMLSPETFLERVRAEIRDLESSVIYVEGQRDLLASQKMERMVKLNKCREDLVNVEESIAALEAKRFEGIDLSALKQQIDDLYMRYDELSRDKGSAPETAEVDAEIFATQSALEKRRAESYESKFAQQIADTKAAIKNLRVRYNKETAVLNGLRPGIQCPMCKQDVTEQNIEYVKKSFTDSIAEVVDNGRAYSKQLAEINTLDEKAKAVFQQFQADDISKLETQLGQLRHKRDEIISAADAEAELCGQTMDQLKGRIQTLEFDIENGNLSFDEMQSLNSLISTTDALTTEIAGLADESGSDNKDADIESLKNSIKQKRELETAAKLYIAERNQLMFSELGALSRVSIVLNETVKTTGEFKDVFKFSFDSKPYKYLSLSEKIKAGVEVSELIKRLTGRHYPLFIDNGESIPVIDNVKPSGQVFVAQVVKGAPLEVDIISSGVSETQKAA